MNVEQISIVQLSNLLRQRESDIVEGRNKLSLTASLLQKINYALHEQEYNHVSATSSFADVPEEPIQFLQDLIHKTPKLTVAQKVKRETWRVDLSRFNKLKYLELIRIPMHLVEGIQTLRSQLEVLVCERCTDCLEEILGSSDKVWDELRTAKLCYNDFVFLCPFTNTPRLQYLDLSYNKIEDRQSLQTLKNITYLNLSFNFLSSVPMLSEDVYHKLKVLLINNNYIQDLSAISNYETLEVLDASNNLLADHSAISPIMFLPNLQCINLSNNPISYHPYHRFHTCSYLNKGVIPDKFLLDGKPLNILEQRAIGRRGEMMHRIHGNSLPRDLPCQPSGSKSQQVAKSVPKRRVRDGVIEEGTPIPKLKAAVKAVGTNREHLQTKKQMEEIRERYGGDHWLHSQAGSFVQDLMGLQRSSGNGILSSTPSNQELILHSPKRVTPINQIEVGSSSHLETLANEDYISALTTQAIVEKVPSYLETTTSESSDQEKELTSSSSQLHTAESSALEESFAVDESSADETIKNKPVEVEEEDEEEESDDGELWLVKKSSVNGKTIELFLTLNEKELREKSTSTGRTITRWRLEAVKSCEKTVNDPPTIQITFNTVRKACQERTYVLEFPDAQELQKRMSSILEGRSLNAMNQVAYRCMKCSSMFSVETTPTVLDFTSDIDPMDPKLSKQVVKCPACGSTLVVEMEEAPLPSADKTVLSQPSNEQATPTVLSSPLKNSPSDCSIGSAASLEQRSEMESEPRGESENAKEGNQNLRKYDSDIEVISNPSQSSIEVLEVQARMQGSLTPNRKRSHEERPTVAVPQLNTVPEVQNNLTGLTESSSSGSLTDSVCTAYESIPVVCRRTGMSDVPEESTPSSTPANTYTSLLEGLIQSVTSKFTPKNSPAVADYSLDNQVPYSFTDFSQADHRVKFYLFQNTFRDDNEELVFILRGNLLNPTGEPRSGCLVVSTHSVYILHVIAPEIGDDASDWFEQKSSHRLSELTAVIALPWQLGSAFRIGTAMHLVLFNNPSHTSNFFKFIKLVVHQEGSEVQNVIIEDEPSLKSEKLLSDLITFTVSASSGPVDSTVKHLAICSSASVSTEEDESLQLTECPILITTTDLLLLKPEFAWLLNFSSEFSPQSAAQQKLANIIEVSLNGLELKLHYLNEAENLEETWGLEMSSLENVNLIIESIRGPWEQLFSVPLQLTRKH